MRSPICGVYLVLGRTRLGYHQPTALAQKRRGVLHEHVGLRHGASRHDGILSALRTTQLLHALLLCLHLPVQAKLANELARGSDLLAHRVQQQRAAPGYDSQRNAREASAGTYVHESARRRGVKRATQEQRVHYVEVRTVLHAGYAREVHGLVLAYYQCQMTRQQLGLVRRQLDVRRKKSGAQSLRTPLVAFMLLHRATRALP